MSTSRDVDYLTYIYYTGQDGSEAHGPHCYQCMNQLYREGKLADVEKFYIGAPTGLIDISLRSLILFCGGSDAPFSVKYIAEDFFVLSCSQCAVKAVRLQISEAPRETYHRPTNKTKSFRFLMSKSVHYSHSISSIVPKREHTMQKKKVNLAGNYENKVEMTASRNVDHLTYTYYKDQDGSESHGPHCHKCMNELYHDEQLVDVEMVFINTPNCLIAVPTHLLVFSYGSDAPFSMSCIAKDFFVQRCTRCDLAPVSLQIREPVKQMYHRPTNKTKSFRFVKAKSMFSPPIRSITPEIDHRIKKQEENIVQHCEHKEKETLLRPSRKTKGFHFFKSKSSDCSHSISSIIRERDTTIERNKNTLAWNCKAPLPNDASMGTASFSKESLVQDNDNRFVNAKCSWKEATHQPNATPFGAAAFIKVDYSVQKHDLALLNGRCCSEVVDPVLWVDGYSSLLPIRKETAMDVLEELACSYFHNQEIINCFHCDLQFLSHQGFNLMHHLLSRRHWKRVLKRNLVFSLSKDVEPIVEFVKMKCGDKLFELKEMVIFACELELASWPSIDEMYYSYSLLKYGEVRLRLGFY